MPRIIDQYGNPIDRGALREPQTSRIAALENQFLTPMLAGLTPDRLAQHLKAADDGDLTGQHRLFADMEERDAHLLAEMSKRKLAVMSLDWDVRPPRAATAHEKRAAEWVSEVLTDAVTPFEDLVLALMDGVGHGFAAVELVWRSEGREWLPEFSPRPQEWFRLDRPRRALRLIDNSAEGAPLQPFGWALHTHGTPKTGYLGRAGLHRCLVWPFIYKAFGLGDFAEFLETYGLPIIVGKYQSTALPEDRSSLLRAVQALGHDARAIMPADMQLEIQKITGGGDSTPHLAMIDWADRAQSKAILGQTTSSEARATGLGSGIATEHGAVRRDIRAADARQIAGTITRDVIYPLIALNLGGIDGLRRCPRLAFDAAEAEDIGELADGIGKLAAAGMTTIPVAWVHEKLRIPEPAAGEAVLQPASPAAQEAPPPHTPPHGGAHDQAALAGIAAVPSPATSLPWAARAAGQLAADAQPAIDAWLATIRHMLDAAGSLEEFGDMLLAAYPELDAAGMAAALRQALTAADLQGRAEVRRETGQ